MLPSILLLNASLESNELERRKSTYLRRIATHRTAVFLFWIFFCYNTHKTSFSFLLNYYYIHSFFLFKVHQSLLLQKNRSALGVRNWPIYPGSGAVRPILYWRNIAIPATRKKKDEIGGKLRLKIKVFESKTRAPICTYKYPH